MKSFRHKKTYKNLVKPALDVSAALFLLILTLPLTLLTAVILAIQNEGRIFFYQSRPGKNEKIFKVIKFKTMNDKTDHDGNLLSDDDRLTTIGKLIRKFSIDELPQLINVLKGELSLVGPRPLLVEYLTLYNSREKRRHEVKPGITGWAQVNGRNNVSWKEKFEMDVWYVDNQSFLLDLKILFLTVIKVIQAEGIGRDGALTTVKFNGKN